MSPGRFDLIIGTQLVAKGHHFPSSTWSASSTPISASPTAIHAAERTFQLLHQVVGRAAASRRGYGSQTNPSIR